MPEPHQSEPLQSIVDDPFVEQLAALLIPLGLAPIPARMQGLLMISLRPLTLDEMASALQASKSSVSVAARLLERYGVALRLPERGSKRVRYAISERPGGFLYDQMAFLGDMGQLLSRKGDAAGEGPLATRLHTMSAFLVHIRDALDVALRAK